MTRLPTFDLPSLPSLGGTAARRAPGVSSIAPEDEESIIRKAGRKTLGGIAAVGNVLDLPGSMVRDVLALENPLDQLLHPFSGESRTSGRDLLRKYGMAGRKDTWGNFAGGLAADILTDPLTYIFPFGKATKAGEIMKAANLTDKAIPLVAKQGRYHIGTVGPRFAGLKATPRQILQNSTRDELRAAHNAAKAAGVKLSDIADDPLRGMFATGFMGKAKHVTGFGPKSEMSAALLDTLGNRVKNFNIPGTDIQPLNALTRLFSAPLGDTKTGAGQTFARQLFNLKTAARSQAMKEVAGYIDELRQTGHATDAEADWLRSWLEGTKTGPLDQRTADLVAKLQTRQKSILAEGKEWGTSPREWRSPYAEYWPRYLSDRVGTPSMSGSSFSQFDAFQKGSMRRKGFLSPFTDANGTVHAIKGETETIKTLLKDPRFEALITGAGGQSPANVKALARWIQQNYGHLIPKYYAKKATTASGSIPLAPTKSSVGNRYVAIAKWAAKRNPELRQAGVFANNPLLDMQAQLISHNDAIAAAKTVHEFLTSPGVLQPSTQAANVRGSMTVGQILKQLRIKTGDINEGFGMKLADSIGIGNAIRQTAQLDPKAAKTMFSEMFKMRVNNDLAKDMVSFRNMFTSPRPVNEIMRAVQSVTNLWKGAQTALWPAFHVRNLVSGQYQNYVAGMFDIGSTKDTLNLIRGKAIAGSKNWKVLKQLAADRGMTNLTDQQATDLLGQLAYAEGLSHRFAGEAMAVAGGTQIMPSNIEDVMREIPGMGVNHINLGRIARKAIAREPGTSLNPFKSRGWFDRPQSEFGPMAAGEEIAGIVESMNRIAPFINQLKRGVDPTAAAKKIGAAQVMYQGRYFTKFEQQAMATVFPFYKFSAKVMPWTLRQLAEQPTGRLGTTIRIASRLRNPDVMTPDYVAETTSVPLGESPDGSQRYLTGAGLMFEDPLSFLGGGVRGALLEAGSRMNPLLKMPLEWGTGQTFFQKGPMGGRSLEDLDPTIGRTLANLTGQRDPVKFPGSDAVEYLAGNSPLSRALSTGRQLSGLARPFTDPQMKGQAIPEIAKTATNLLTGLRVTNVSPAAQESLLRERVQQMMRQAGGKTFVRSYIPEEVEASMSPKELEDSKKLEALINTLAKRAKARAEARKAADSR